MRLIEERPTYTFVLFNACVFAWWALLAVPRFPAKLSLVVLLSSLAVVNLTLLVAKHSAKRGRNDVGGQR